MSFTSDFKAPPVSSRPKPFWFWNDEMPDNEIERQIGEMAQKGLGGFFLCARQGLGVPYLSAEWFRKAALACACAKRSGLECWLYDEYPYPSGMAGGEVLIRHPEAVQRRLTFCAQDTAQGEICLELGGGNLLYAFAVPLRGGSPDWGARMDLMPHVGILQTHELCQPQSSPYIRLRYFSHSVRHVLQTQLPPGQWRILAVSEEPIPDFKYYGALADPCCKEATQEFLALTHERYAQYLGSEFGKTVKGFFSDEVGLLGPRPWSHLMLTEFPKCKGYSLSDVFPALYWADFPDAARIRCDYTEVLAELLAEGYHKPVGNWCRAHGLAYVSEVPSLRASTQAYSTVVGGDTAHEKVGTPLEKIYDTYLCGYRYNAKHVGSLAAQTGRRAMIESFHSVGWSMTLQDAKWMLDRLGADGIDFFVFHAFYASVRGMRRHDAAPSQFEQNPYWPHYRHLADYAARLSVLNTYTAAADGLALLDPSRTLWALSADPLHGFCYMGNDDTERAALENTLAAWRRIGKTLLFAQLNYQTLDEEILAAARVQGDALCVGRARYRAVILPPLDAMDAPALARLREFSASGGMVIGLLPSALPAELPAAHWIAQEDTESLLALAARAADLPVHTKAAPEVCRSLITAHRLAPDGKHFVFLANQGTLPAAVRLVPQPHTAPIHPQRWDLEAGTVTPLPVQNGALPLTLAPLESALICLDGGAAPAVLSAPQQELVFDTSSGCLIQAEGPNVLRLGAFSLSLDGTHRQSVTVPTLEEQLVQTSLLRPQDLCWTKRFGTPRQLAVRYPLSVLYHTQFSVHVLPPCAALVLDAESLRGAWTMRLNGHSLTEKDFTVTPYYDTANQACDVAALLRPGENDLEIFLTAQDGSGGLCAPLFLYGNFGVRGNAITSLPKRGGYGVPTRGFPYYAGTLCFTRTLTVQRVCDTLVKCDFGDTRRDCMELLVNGRSVGVRAFAPYTWQVPAPVLRAGRNRFSLRVTGTLAPLFEGMFFDEAQHRLVPADAPVLGL